MTTCRVCGDQLHAVYVSDTADDLEVSARIEWCDDNEDVLCPAKDWDDGAGPYHEPKETV